MNTEHQVSDAGRGLKQHGPISFGNLHRNEQIGLHYRLKKHHKDDRHKRNAHFPQEVVKNLRQRQLLIFGSIAALVDLVHLVLGMISLHTLFHLLAKEDRQHEAGDRNGPNSDGQRAAKQDQTNHRPTPSRPGADSPPSRCRAGCRG